MDCECVENQWKNAVEKLKKRSLKSLFTLAVFNS